MEKVNTSPTNGKDLASEYALRVALQTLKERCIALQRRVTLIEEENQVLRERLDKKPILIINDNEVDNDELNCALRMQVLELGRQKQQLAEHISMVSTENRKLWSRLSCMAKEQQSNKYTGEEEDGVTTSRLNEQGGINTNLTRSKTFTQHSPNPYLRYEVIPDEIGFECKTGFNLHVVNSDSSGNKNIKGKKCLTDAANSDMIFSCLNVDEPVFISSSMKSGDAANENDFNLEAKRCIDGLQEMRREAMCQQRDLNSALNILRNIFAKSACLNCSKSYNKPEMADKSLETDESINENILYRKSILISKNESKRGDDNGGTDYPLNIIIEKKEADQIDKTCPMCGNIFNCQISFNQFREHVESHFIDDSIDFEANIDRHFEFISHAVGDF